MDELVTDELWRQFRPLIPGHPKDPRGGRPRADDRRCLEGIVYVLRTGVPWHLFPDRQFGVSKSTCYDRFGEWCRCGVFAGAHRRLLNRLGLRGRVDLSAAVIDSASVRAVFGGRTPGPAPSTAAKTAANATSSATPGAPRC
jgi:transposase